MICDNTELRIHTSGVTKALLDQVGGFRCEYRGLLDLGVMTSHDGLHCHKIPMFCSQPKRGHLESWWLIGPDTEPGEEPANQEAGLNLALGD